MSEPKLPTGYAWDDGAPALPKGYSWTEPQAEAAPESNFGRDLNALKALGVGAVKGTIGLFGLPADATNIGSKAIDYLAGTKTNESVAPYADKFGSSAIRAGVENLTGPLREPQGAVEQALDTAGQFLPALIGGPESLALKLGTRVAAPALASEAAGEATRGTAAEPYARAAAAILGGGLAGAATHSLRPFEAPTQAETFASAKSRYESPEVKNLELTPQAGKEIAADLRQRLMAAKVDKFNGQGMYDVADRLESPRFGKNITIEDLEAARQDAKVNPVTATPADKRGSEAIRKGIDSYLNGNIPAAHVLTGDAAAANETLIKARADFAAAKRDQDVMNALARSENQAGSTYSGGNLDNASRQALRPILNEKQGVSKRPGFQDYTPEELAALKKAVNGNWIGNQLRSSGKQLGGGGGHGNSMAVIGSMITAHEMGAEPAMALMLGLGAGAAGRTLNAAANKLTYGRDQQLSNLLRSRSALADEKMAAQTFLPNSFSDIRQAIPPGLLAQALVNANQPLRLTIHPRPGYYDQSQ